MCLNAYLANFFTIVGDVAGSRREQGLEFNRDEDDEDEGAENDENPDDELSEEDDDVDDGEDNDNPNSDFERGMHIVVSECRINSKQPV